MSGEKDETVFRQMADDEYFADPAVDQTMLKRFLVSPIAYQWAIDHPVGETSAMRFGTACHALALGSGAPVVEAPNRRTKEGKALAAKYEEQGATVLPAADYAAVRTMAGIVHPVFQEIGGRPETAMIATDPQTGIRIKGKADWLPDKTDPDGVYWVYDYKTARSLDGWDRHFVDLGYHIQAAFYLRLLSLCDTAIAGPVGFRFLVQEKQPPYDWMVRELQADTDDQGILAAANAAIDRALAGLASYRALPDPAAAMRSVGRDHDPKEVRLRPWELDALWDLARGDEK